MIKYIVKDYTHNITTDRETIILAEFKELGDAIDHYLRLTYNRKIELGFENVEYEGDGIDESIRFLWLHGKKDNVEIDCIISIDEILV